jgi:hypothetical protein
MADSASNEMTPHGRETDFRRDVRDVLGLSPFDRDDQLIAEVRRLRWTVTQLEDDQRKQDGLRAGPR